MVTVGTRDAGKGESGAHFGFSLGEVCVIGLFSLFSSRLLASSPFVYRSNLSRIEKSREAGVVFVCKVLLSHREPWKAESYLLEAVVSRLSPWLVILLRDLKYSLLGQLKRRGLCRRGEV